MKRTSKELWLIAAGMAPRHSGKYDAELYPTTMTLRSQEGAARDVS
jgi:hypothetical protein